MVEFAIHRDCVGSGRFYAPGILAQQFKSIHELTHCMAQNNQAIE